MSALMSLKDECQRCRDLVVRAAQQRQDVVARLTESQRIGGNRPRRRPRWRKNLRVANLLPIPDTTRR